MTENKNNFEFVHRGRVPLSELTCPEVVKKSVHVLKKKHINVPETAILNILRADFGHLVMSKKVSLISAREKIVPGQFAMVLLKSGVGKDYTRNDIKKYLFKQHRIWFEGQAEMLYQQMLELYETQQLEEKDKKNKIAKDFENRQIAVDKKGDENNVPTAENPF